MRVSYNSGMKPVSPFWRRLQEATPHLEESERSPYLERLCGIKQASVSRWRTGENTPSPRHIAVISSATGFEVTYLTTGNGRRRTRIDDPLLSELLAIVDQLPPADRQAILSFAKFRASDR